MSCSCQLGFYHAAGTDSTVTYCGTTYICASGYQKYTKDTTLCFDLLGYGRTYTAECNVNSNGACCTTSWY